MESPKFFLNQPIYTKIPLDRHIDIGDYGKVTNIITNYTLMADHPMRYRYICIFENSALEFTMDADEIDSIPPLQIIKNRLRDL